VDHKKIKSTLISPSIEIMSEEEIPSYLIKRPNKSLGGEKDWSNFLISTNIHSKP
jgi:hypothetical protein